MSSQSGSNYGGASIQPSARRSIHSHSHGYCPFAHSETMGRYGLKRRELGTDYRNLGADSSKRDTDSSQRGTDEVDNVLSKPLRTSSPSPIRRKVTERRNSYTVDNSHELLSEDNVLSKSLPATFQTYYSDGVADDLEENGPESYNGSGSTLSLTHYRTPLSIQQDLNETEQSDLSRYQSNTSSSAKNVFFGLLIGIIGLVVAYYAVDRKPNNAIYNKINFSMDLNTLGKKYNVGGDSILKVQSGIVTIIDREDTGSFIFVYNSKSSNFQETLFNDFINDIASAAAKLLRNDSTEVHHIVLESSHLRMRSHNEFMNTYRDEVDKTGVMLVKELENVPSNLAMAFHYYCDEYNPLVKKSAIFFTMDLGNCSTYNGQETSNAVIEKCLSNKWDNVPQANIAPLLTRVVGVVVDVSRIF